MRGPIDYFVIGFEGPKMDGSIMKELEQALQDGVIALVALAVVYKDDNGDVMAIDVIEHLWAKPLKQAILESGGQLVAEGRIHPEAERELSELEV
jgi:hypothetical protein